MMEQPPSETTRLLDRTLAAISSIRYGSVSIVIHDAQVVQIEKVEKVRVNQANGSTRGRLEQPAL